MTGPDNVPPPYSAVDGGIEGFIAAIRVDRVKERNGNKEDRGKQATASRRQCNHANYNSHSVAANNCSANGTENVLVGGGI